MVGIVLVSHSRELSEAVKALAEQQIQARAAIVAVGGSEDPFQPFGTDPVAIADAIAEVDSEDGVLVLMDLGSAVIGARVALDLLDPAVAARVRLSTGPFIEGAMAAAVQASIGMDIDAVTREAEDAMQAKRSVLLHDPTAPSAPSAPTTNGDAQESIEVAREVVMADPAGLHFGPAARFVQTAARFKAHVTVTNLDGSTGPADAARFNQLLGLGAEQGHRLRIAASGPDASAAVDALARLATTPPIPAGPPADALAAGGYAPVTAHGEPMMQGIPASPGLALGAAYIVRTPGDLLHTPLALHAAPGLGLDRNRERARIERALAIAIAQLDQLANHVAATIGAPQADIFHGQRLLASDPDMLAELLLRVDVDGLPAEQAVQLTFVQAAQHYLRMSGPVFQQRAADIEDVGRRLLHLLGGIVEDRLTLPGPVIVVAHDLSPSQAAQLDRKHLLGLCIAGGGPESHTAILARSMGIPAVVGLGGSWPDVQLPDGSWLTDGTPLAVDGAHGCIVVAPQPATVASWQQAQVAVQEDRLAAQAAAQLPATTRDGLRIEVVANLSFAADLTAALTNGAEGVGLLRTEFLFQDRRTPPTEEEQYELYAAVAQQLGERPLVVRTLDLGGDKPAPYLPLPAEANPFLGWRAIRISLALPEFFKCQLRALLRAGALGDVHILLPMISHVDEYRRTQALLAECVAELAAAGTPYRANLPLGVMVEIPSTVQMMDQLAPLVDFFSLGTNDLAQYTFAADRTNERVAALADALHPAMLRQIDTVLRAAHAHGKWCGLCGELAGQPAAIPILLGLGLDEFSMAPAAIPAAKQLISRLAMPVARRVAQKALTLPSAAAVRELADTLLNYRA